MICAADALEQTFDNDTVQNTDWHQELLRVRWAVQQFKGSIFSKRPRVNERQNNCTIGSFHASRNLRFSRNQLLASPLFASLTTFDSFESTCWFPHLIKNTSKETSTGRLKLFKTYSVIRHLHRYTGCCCLGPAFANALSGQEKNE